MPFSFEQFYLRNQRVLIWLVLAVLLYLLRDFFGLIFIVYVLALFVLPLARQLHRRLRLPRRAALVVVYLLMLGAMFGFVRFVTPKVAGEVARMVNNLGTIQQRLIEADDRFAERYPNLQQPLMSYLRGTLNPQVRESLEASLSAEAARLGLPEAAAHAPTRYDEEHEDDASQRLVEFEQQLLLSSLFDELAGVVRKHAPQAIKLLYQGTATLGFGLLFSFLILVDQDRLSRLVEGLRHSRLRHFYDQAAEPILRLSTAIGMGLRAQSTIALLNAVLTAIGLMILGVPSIAMLTVIVFLCGLVPVVGTFVSTVPIVLMAINGGGVKLVLLSLALVAIIHAVESYLLNPLIYGKEFSFNPVLTLIILFVAYHAFGVWGMVLGLPIARYLLKDVFQVPLDNEAAAASAD